MSKILIENYRGFDIEFDTSCEKFQCVATDEDVKESTSFTAVKKFVDDYKKINQDFKPFWIEPNPSSYFKSKDKLKVVGIRKDGRFVAENSKGEKQQISDYNLTDYIIFKIENEPILKSLKELNAEDEQQRSANEIRRKQIIKTLNIISLKEFKESIK